MISTVTLRIEHEPMPADELCEYVRDACEWRLNVLGVEAVAESEPTPADAIRAAHEAMQARNAEATRRQAEWEAENFPASPQFGMLPRSKP